MVGLRMEDSSIVYTVYAVLMVVAGTVLYCCSKIMDEYMAPKHPAQPLDKIASDFKKKNY